MIDAEGNQVGVVSLSEALSQAQDAELDLVEISPNPDLPVCRIMDFGKFQFQKNKQQAAAKKNQKKTTVKEIKFRPSTDEGDYQVKVRKLTEFLQEGNKAKVTIRFMGREMAHKEIGAALLDRVKEDLKEIGVVDQTPKLEGRQLTMLLSPKKSS